MKKNRLVAAFVCLPLFALADEGMWTVDNFPADAVEEKYGVRIGDAWLDASRLATVRLENGCTGSFASANGLILTNNHCTWGCIRNLSSAERNLSDEGFMAVERQDELQCPSEQVSVLVDFDDVTQKVAAATAELADAEANEARKAELTRLESACEEDSEETFSYMVKRLTAEPAEFFGLDVGPLDIGSREAIDVALHRLTRCRPRLGSSRPAGRVPLRSPPRCRRH